MVEDFYPREHNSECHLTPRVRYFGKCQIGIGGISRGKLYHHRKFSRVYLPIKLIIGLHPKECLAEWWGHQFR